MERSIQNNIKNNMDSNFGLNAGTGTVSILTTLYIVNNQIKPIKDDVNRLVGDVGEIIQQKEDIDQVKNDIKELMSLYTDRENKLLAVIGKQEEHIQFLTETVMDLQVGVYRELKLETKPMPSEFLPNRMTNRANVSSYRGTKNDGRLKTSTQRDYENRDYENRDYESNHREYDSKNYTNRSRHHNDTRNTRYAVRDKVKRDDSRNGDTKNHFASRGDTKNHFASRTRPSTGLRSGDIKKSDVMSRIDALGL